MRGRLGGGISRAVSGTGCCGLGRPGSHVGRRAAVPVRTEDTEEALLAHPPLARCLSAAVLGARPSRTAGGARVEPRLPQSEADRCQEAPLRSAELVTVLRVAWSQSCFLDISVTRSPDAGSGLIPFPGTSLVGPSDREGPCRPSARLPAELWEARGAREPLQFALAAQHRVPLPCPVGPQASTLPQVP